ncbi:MAG: hypothetical protein IPI91_06775 [Flavobacteriales bacterium]|nr:hypothetical protein [Flavobacteriales bacterium]
MQMNYRAVLFGSCLSVVSSHAQWTNDAYENTTVRDGIGVTALRPVMCNGPAGSTYIAWYEQVDTLYEVRMQRIDAAGFAMWDVEGVIVSPNAAFAILSGWNPKMFPMGLIIDHDGNAILGFSDKRTGVITASFYKLDSAGVSVWDENGIVAGDSLGVAQQTVSMDVYDDNSVVATWNSEYGSVYYNKFHSDGETFWQVPLEIPVVVISQPFVSIGKRPLLPKPIVQQDGGFLVQLLEHESGNEGSAYVSNYRLKVARINQNGTFLGLDQFVANNVEHAYMKPAVADGLGGFYIAHRGYWHDPLFDGKLRLQHYRSDGTTWGANGIIVAPLIGVGSDCEISLLPNGNGVIVGANVDIVFIQGGEENLMPPSHLQVVVQRVDTAGVLQWAENGTLIADNANCDFIGLTATDDGSVFTYIQDSLIKATHIGFDGEFLWEPNIGTVCSRSGLKSNGSTSAVHDGNMVVAWQDDRINSGVYAQRIPIENGPDIPTATSSVSIDNSSLSIRPFQNNDQLWLATSNTSSGLGMIRVLDTAGRTLHVQNAYIASGTNQIPVNTHVEGAAIVELSLNGDAKRAMTVVH